MGWPGKTYFGKNPFIKDAEEHLHFVLTSAEDDNDKIAVVGMTSIDDAIASPCILDPDDEDCANITKFLTRRSTIAYFNVRTPTVSEFCAGIGKVMHRHADVPLSLVKRIQDGLLAVEEHVNPEAIELIKKERGLSV